jgi:ATP-dependent protease ClpP protease subunit
MIDYSKRFGARVADMWAKVKPEATGLHIRAAASGAVELLIYDAIGADMWGEGVTAKSVVAALADAGDKPVVARINSPGGDVFDGMAIYNALRGHAAGVTVRVDGLAASAASVIAMAGECTMAQASQMMIHNSWALAIGNKADMRKMADTMDKIDGQMAAVYAAKSGRPAEDMQALMDAETWLTAQEAVDAGLADAMDAPAKKTAKAETDRSDIQAAAGEERSGESAVETENTDTRERARRVRHARLKIALAE